MSLNPAYFRRPSRYIGNEINIIRKRSDLLNTGVNVGDCPPQMVSVALCFPDTYEIGMSHLGLRILYSIINKNPAAKAERFFAPWVDYESLLRKNGLPITSLENNIPLRNFDIIGFTLQYELSYTNILNMIDLGGLPIRSADREEHDPVIIAGGPCAVNPLPLAPFIDAFVIGDGEEVIEEIIETFSGYRDKKSRLKSLSTLEGIFVPAIHFQGRKKIRKRIVKSLDDAHFPDAPIVPYAPIVHDRVTIEISRGCTRGCRFCQAGMIYRPHRERSLENVLFLSRKSIENTGHEEISFTSLSTGDYSSLPSLIKTFNSICPQSHIAISLPSLRVGAVNREILREIKSVRKTGFTIAPEAGTKRLRNVINKDFTEEEYINTLERLFAEGWQKIKLYFMIGLPTETEEDIRGIIHMTETALLKGRKITGNRVNINVGISAFVPKPHTPFQWSGQMPFKDLRVKQDILRKAFKRKGINFKGQHVELSLLEAVFSRGDMDCAHLLEAAWRGGCRFDSWSEIFDFNKWLSASEKTGINMFRCASRSLDLDKELPWEFINTGITGAFLKSEYKKALEEEITEDCRDVCCNCGIGCNPGIRVPDVIRQMTDGEILKPVIREPKTEIKTAHLFKKTPHTKLRVRFSKTGILSYLSHREVITAILRATRRAKILLVYSGGFHPHPRISFGPALPLGVEGMNEYFDIEIASKVNPLDVPHILNSSLPRGLEILEAVPVTKNSVSLDDFISRYDYKIAIDKTMHKSIHSFLELPGYFVSRGKTKVDIRPMVEKAEINNGYLDITLVDTDAARVRLYELLQGMFQKPVEEIQTLSIRRARLYGSSKEGWADPLEGERIWQMR
jgi:radical SAM family uncharacterized protein/radical SAM-linked protein